MDAVFKIKPLINCKHAKEDLSAAVILWLPVTIENCVLLAFSP